MSFPPVEISGWVNFVDKIKFIQRGLFTHPRVFWPLLYISTSCWSSWHILNTKFDSSSATHIIQAMIGKIIYIGKFFHFVSHISKLLLFFEANKAELISEVHLLALADPTINPSPSIHQCQSIFHQCNQICLLKNFTNPSKNILLETKKSSIFGSEMRVNQNELFYCRRINSTCYSTSHIKSYKKVI